MKRFVKQSLVFLLAGLLLVGCAAAPADQKEEPEEENYIELAEVEVPLAGAVSAPQSAAELGTVASAKSPAAVVTSLMPAASGTLVKQTERAVIDYSHTDDGYVMVQYLEKTDKRLKVQVKGPVTTYLYDLTAGEWEVFPLTDGNGTYQVTVYRNVTGSKYVTELSVSAAVTLKDEFAPYLYPNQYVDYTAASNAVMKAAELTAGKEKTLEKVAAIYDFVVNHLTYDYDKARTVQSGYLPVLDSVLESGKGICFDYASLMTGMLRSQGIPCKLVIGYAGGVYHAWINVWSAEDGWVDGVIFFDGISWERMDPTFASSSKESAAVLAYIGDGSNYAAKYLY